jgi:hypothetical protein
MLVALGRAPNHRDVAADGQALGERPFGDLLGLGDRLLDRHVDVLLAVGLVGREKHRDLGGAGGERALEPLEVRHQ